MSTRYCKPTGSRASDFWPRGSCCSRWPDCICWDCCDWKAWNRASTGHRAAVGRERHSDLRVQPVAGNVRRAARRTGRVRSRGRPRMARPRPRPVPVDEEPVSRGAGCGEAGEQAGAGDLHRLRLHQLPLDEGQMFPRPEIAEAMKTGPGGALHRRHRQGSEEIRSSKTTSSRRSRSRITRSSTATESCSPNSPEARRTRRNSSRS